ncbi:hypothetical protein AB835_11150 [Candidatus Endobugula sertula]|uniref:4'-phosphopantetheinyl transferase domain-containing protein n=1 Tax=Candidatus Endobugula sertula TaxID=62101 RepID=A0A1D2QN53_9GAMM|nr:hypothetical protein AB835_11150 [Candidatus Endobugula sertula]
MAGKVPLERYQTLLSDDEKQRKQNLYFVHHQYQYLLSRALIRSVLSAYDSHVAPGDWRFVKNDYGKPAIDASISSLPLCFNLSHTKDMIVLAVTLEQSVGIDVESIRMENVSLDIARSFFSNVETEFLFALPEPDQRQHFFCLWTLKEAYIKARGMGLSIPLDQFSFLFSDKGGIDICFGSEICDTPKDWAFWQFSLVSEYLVSLALKKETDKNQYLVSIYYALDLLSESC